jgi:hypothetical protein
MKTIKILVIVFILLGFASKAVNGQAEVFRGTVPMCAYLDCVGELVCGEFSYNGVSNKNMNMSNEHSIFIGQTSGTVYKVMGINHYQINKMRRQEPKDCAASRTDQHTYIIHANGEIIAKLQVVFHMTINANGELTAWVEPDSYSVECF